MLFTSLNLLYLHQRFRLLFCLIRKSEIEYYAMLAKTGVHHYSGNNIELGTACGKYYRVCTLAIIDPGEYLRHLYSTVQIKCLSSSSTIYWNYDYVNWLIMIHLFVDNMCCLPWFDCVPPYRIMHHYTVKTKSAQHKENMFDIKWITSFENFDHCFLCKFLRLMDPLPEVVQCRTSGLLEWSQLEHNVKLLSRQFMMLCQRHLTSCYRLFLFLFS